MASRRSRIRAKKAASSTPTSRRQKRVSAKVPSVGAIAFGRDVCGRIAESERREWLVTNGIGGFASGTIAGLATRRYHGLLIAALAPPLGRRLLVSAIDEIVTVDGIAYELGAHRWAGGALAPQGYRYLERFELDGSVPVWTYVCAQTQLQKRIWMEQGANRTYVSYRLSRGTAALALKVLVNDRDFHGNTHAGDGEPHVEAREGGIVVATELVPLEIRSDAGDVVIEHAWYRDALLARETARGLDDRDDAFFAATFRATLRPGASLTIVCGVPEVPDVDAPAAYARARTREANLLTAFRERNGDEHPPWIERFALAADAFVVRRSVAQHADARSIVAGYHWFGDWGRDTTIALPGVALCTGRSAVAATILETFAHYVSDGMLPNYFPDAGGTPEYNTVDAALWYVEAMRLYYAETGDAAFVRRFFGVLAEIVARYAAGTRFGIHQDRDGLLTAGAPGVALTWMDARVGERAITPRSGKAVEINALWYNALDALASLAPLADADPVPYEAMRERTRAGFDRYWNAERGYLYDVLDGPAGNDPSLRPNAIFAAALTASPLHAQRRRAVVDVCARELVTSFGLRSLAPSEAGYRGSYAGAMPERDAAYHQGTAWGWLIGPFAIAHFRAYGDAAAALAYLEPMADQLLAYGLGTAGEIADGDPPHRADGCVAQAWTVGEILRAYLSITSSH